MQAEKYEAAKQQFERLNKDGYHIATTYLGLLYLEGRGVAKDDAEAVRLFRQAAEAGDALGALGFGEAYGRGVGVAVDQAEAVRWFRKAAELGSTTALTFLAEIYEKGDSVPEDAAAGETPQPRQASRLLPLQPRRRRTPRTTRRSRQSPRYGGTAEQERDEIQRRSLTAARLRSIRVRRGFGRLFPRRQADLYARLEGIFQLPEARCFPSGETTIWQHALCDPRPSSAPTSPLVGSSGEGGGTLE